jgi:hypothetical protein
MPVELDIIRASEFVRLDPQEHLDFEASKRALEALALACWKRGLDRALLDLRALPVLARPWFTQTELAALVRTFQEAGFSRQQRLAVLYQYDVHGGIRNFAFFSRMRGLRVRAFQDFEEAFSWLSKKMEGKDESRPEEVAIPITQPRNHPRKLPANLSAAQHSTNRTSRPVHRTTHHDN